MSITSVAKIFGSQKAQKAMKTVMNKGFKVKGEVPNSLLKQIPGADEFVRDLQKLGYKNVTLKGGIKGGKNTVTGMLSAYSGKKHIGYLAGGLDANGAKPIMQLRGSVTPKIGQPIRFNGIADANKALTNPLDSAVDLSVKHGKTVANADLGAVKAHIDGDMNSVIETLRRFNPEHKVVKELDKFNERLQFKWADLFTPKTKTPVKKARKRTIEKPLLSKNKIIDKESLTLVKDGSNLKYYMDNKALEQPVNLEGYKTFAKKSDIDLVLANKIKKQ